MNEEKLRQGLENQSWDRSESVLDFSSDFLGLFTQV